MACSWLKMLAAATLAAALLAPVGASAQEMFSEWDFNDNNIVDNAEWTAGWDRENAFGDWDTNDDSIVDEAEWTVGWDREGAFEDWDTNDDNALDNAELGAGLYRRFDADETAGLSEEEFAVAEGLFEYD